MKRLFFILSFSALSAQPSLRMEFDRTAFEFLQKTAEFDFYEWKEFTFQAENVPLSSEQSLHGFEPGSVFPWVVEIN